MSETLSLVAATFGLIGLGYASVRSGLLAAAVGSALTDFVFKIAIPLLLFQTLAEADMHGVSPWRIWAAYFIPFALVWSTAHLTIRRVFGRDARAGVVAGGSAAYSNGVLIGLPVIHAAFGEPGTVFLIVIVSVHLPIMMLASIVLNEWALRADGLDASAAPRREALRRLAHALLTHPVLLAIMAGLLWRATGLAIPAVIVGVVEPLGRSGGPLALFASGMALVGTGVARQVAPAVALAALKLMLLPALVYAAARIGGLPPLGVAVATLVAAMPTGVNAFLVATRLGTGQALASNVLLFSTAGGVVTVTLWLNLLAGTPVTGGSPSPAISAVAVSPPARRAARDSEPRDFDSLAPEASRTSRWWK